jgi:phosphoserine phosphatase
MGDAGFGRSIWARCQNAKVTVGLQAVGVDDNGVELVGQFEAKRGFAACRGAGKNDNRRLAADAAAGVGRWPMSTVVTLIAGAGVGSDLACGAALIADALDVKAGPVWLAPGEACDVVFHGEDPARVEEAARGLLGGMAADVLVQPLRGRRKRLLVADLESTIIENEMLDELADFLGLRPQVSEITRRAMNGEIDFVAALESRVGLLKGMQDRVLDEAESRIRLTPGARQLVATMRSAGAVTALVSGGFMVFADRVAAELGFDYVVANRLETSVGRIQGTVQKPIVTGETKRQTLLALAAEHGISPEETMAVGDGANDLPMLATAGLGVAFRAKPSVAAAARWRIDHGDLTGLLYAQGYRREEIVGGGP